MGELEESERTCQGFLLDRQYIPAPQRHHSLDAIILRTTVTVTLTTEVQQSPLFDKM